MRWRDFLVGIAAVTIAAQRARAYFAVTHDGKNVASIDRHPHLKIGA